MHSCYKQKCKVVSLNLAQPVCSVADGRDRELVTGVGKTPPPV